MLKSVHPANLNPQTSPQDAATDDASHDAPSQPVGLVAQIVEDWNTHGRDSTRPGFQALAVHRFGNWRMGIGPKIVRAP